jgi:hypothetical protein
MTRAWFLQIESSVAFRAVAPCHQLRTALKTVDAKEKASGGSRRRTL